MSESRVGVRIKMTYAGHFIGFAETSQCAALCSLQDFAWLRLATVCTKRRKVTPFCTRDSPLEITQASYPKSLLALIYDRPNYLARLSSQVVWSSAKFRYAHPLSKRSNKADRHAIPSILAPWRTVRKPVSIQ